MLERNVYEHYYLFSDERFIVGQYEAFLAGDSLYLVVPAENSAHLPLEEMLRMVHFLQQQGEKGVPELVFTNKKQERAYIDGQEALLFKIPNDCNERGEIESRERIARLGFELATFHERGQNYTSGQGEHLLYQQWKDSWIMRLEQLERWYTRLLKSKGIQEFDEAFIMTFPYYLGMTENAIQYVTDCELDEPNWAYDEPTIAHVSFHDRSWLFMNEASEPLKLPTQMIVDVPSRDIAEYMRDVLLNEESPEEKIPSFIYDYEQVRPLDRRSWRKIYARLLFPLHYFETVEGFYASQLEVSKQFYAKRFFHLLGEEGKHEQFFQRYFHSLQSMRSDLGGLTVDWHRYQ